MKRLIYISSVTSEIENTDLEKILEASIRNNTATDVSGILLYNGLNFLQVLEGPTEGVDALYQHIAADDRHHGVVTILDEPVNTRAFDTWGMRVNIVPSTAGGAPEGLEYWKDLSANLPAALPGNIRLILHSFNTLKG